MRLQPLRQGLVVGVSAVALVAAVPIASADPVPEGTSVTDAGPAPVHADEHEHSHADIAGLQALGDPFAEGLTLPTDPFVVPGESESDNLVRGIPQSPMDWRGAPPDPGQVPQEWLVEQPATDIVPSTGAELMSADDGYIGGGFADLGAGPRLTEADLMSVPAPPTKDLPNTLDAAPPWQYSYSCDPNNKPGMVAFANLVSSHYGKPTWYGSRACRQGDNSQHYEGRAVDWPMNAYNPSEKAIGDAVAQWITANNGEVARRFGVQSIIWNRQSWYLYKPGSWHPYYGASPHTDHLHISFSWDGAMGRTSWWDGTPVTAHDYGTCRVYAAQYAPRYQGFNGSVCATGLPSAPYSPNPVVLPGANNNYVRQAQTYLGFTGTDLDGSFGPMTLQALLNYQAAKSLPWTGVLDNATWAFMIAAGVPPEPTPPPPAPEPEPEPAPGVVRISGSNRYSTAAELASTFPTGKQLFITVGGDYPDALTAAARAGSLGGPVLLTQETVLPDVTRDAIKALKPSRVTIVGGTGSISGSVLSQVDSLTTAPVVRVGGADRYATAGALAKTFGNRVDVLYVATGLDYPDALAGAARAGYNDGPVLLVKPDSIPDATLSAIQAINPYRVVVLGGPSVVSDAVANQLKDLTRSGNLQRVAGHNRYATAAELAKYYPNGLDTVVVATGQAYPDALSGAARAGDSHGPVLLVATNTIFQPTKDALAQLNPKRILVIGGTEVVSTEVETLLQDYVG
ncbi:cell wall-binding repeat-containing protein [Ornithinimicrobium cryptoxanthini]|uniref:Cell wall-binding repeat-containing protein n=1 Tax=Ornithinimicrobium cryptoxanthini TaxID=2934161 RepID=A0ABY4YJL8_9MICO|nr:cell wall-binding repeat-containing protein [Ornithinimicrobium cryptoxanthini]USQ76332.1 cell wall-binding repeat-containing protein [Ornithinimicrobium cryptoxanthini]